MIILNLSEKASWMNKFILCLLLICNFNEESILACWFKSSFDQWEDIFGFIKTNTKILFLRRIQIFYNFYVLMWIDMKFTIWILVLPGFRLIVDIWSKPSTCPGCTHRLVIKYIGQQTVSSADSYTNRHSYINICIFRYLLWLIFVCRVVASWERLNRFVCANKNIK